MDSNYLIKKKRRLFLETPICNNYRLDALGRNLDNIKINQINFSDITTSNKKCYQWE